MGGGLAALAVAPVSIPAALVVGGAAAVLGTAGVTTGTVRWLRNHGHLRRLQELAAQGRFAPPRQPQAEGIGPRGREFQRPDLMAGQVQFFQTGFDALRRLADMGFVVQGRATSEFTHETTVTGPDGRPQTQRARWSGSMNFNTGSPGPTPGNPWGAGPARPGARPYGPAPPRGLGRAPDALPGPPPPDEAGHDV